MRIYFSFLIFFALSADADLSSIIQSQSAEDFARQTKTRQAQLRFDKECRGKSVGFMDLIQCVRQLQKLATLLAEPTQELESDIGQMERNCRQVEFSKEFIQSADHFVVSDGIEVLGSLSTNCAKKLRDKWEIALYKWN